MMKKTKHSAVEKVEETRKISNLLITSMITIEWVQNILVNNVQIIQKNKDMTSASSKKGDGTTVQPNNILCEERHDK